MPEKWYSGLEVLLVFSIVVLSTRLYKELSNLNIAKKLYKYKLSKNDNCDTLFSNELYVTKKYEKITS